MGWRVITIWECQLKPAVREQTLHELEYWINYAYLEKFKPIRQTYEIKEQPLSQVAEEAGEYKKGKA